MSTHPTHDVGNPYPHWSLCKNSNNITILLYLESANQQVALLSYMAKTPFWVIFCQFRIFLENRTLSIFLSSGPVPSCQKPEKSQVWLRLGSYLIRIYRQTQEGYVIGPSAVRGVQNQECVLIRVMELKSSHLSQSKFFFICSAIQVQLFL